MDTLYEMKNHAVDSNEEKESLCEGKIKTCKKKHASTFDMVPVLTLTRMRKEIKEQIKEQFNKITG